MSAAEQLATLDALVEEANARYSRALNALRNSRDRTAGREALQPIEDYFHGNRSRTRQPDPDELLRLTADACKRIVESGLVFRVPSPGTVELIDPTVEQEERDALAALSEVRTERDEYERVTRDERTRDEDRATMDRVREAIHGNDPEALREALTTDARSASRSERGVRWHV